MSSHSILQIRDLKRLVFMGTPEFAVPGLQTLLAGGWEVRAVVTQPDRPQGRGRRLTPSPVKQCAQAAGVPVLQPAKASDPEFLDTVRALAPDLLVVVAFGQILRPGLLAIPKGGALNVHASLLPRYRGAGPIQWAVLNNESVTGLSAMQIDAGLDTGPVLRQEAFPIGPDETAGELHDRLAELSGPFLTATLQALRDEGLPVQPQDGAMATYAPKIERAMAAIDWAQPAGRIAALMRGMDPWPGAATFCRGRELKLFRPRLVADAGVRETPGRIVAAGLGRVTVATGEGLLEVGELQAPGKRRLPAGDFLRGFPLAPGTAFEASA